MGIINSMIVEKTEEKIVKYIKNKGQASPKELFDYLEISDRAVRKQLKKLDLKVKESAIFKETGRKLIEESKNKTNDSEKNKKNNKARFYGPKPE